MMKYYQKRSHEMMIDPVAEPRCPQSRISLITPTKRTRLLNRDNITQEKLEKLFSTPPPTDQEVKNFIQNNKNRRQLYPIETQNFFTIEEVKELIQKALKEQEQQLCEKFTEILIERLDDQIKTFTQYNNDFLSKNYNKEECTYLS
eukprot:TRINITY_DN841_c0_g4_i1.p1 TRINITY_DN841_c0_g4~~TRINITY_DN841_c0_g4_i1.p1  ORF type:complete len:146 (-),score=55.26 TRINITY_DN841_c0_g4_i1:217-654(-)